MNLSSLINENTNLSVTVGLSDLKEFAKEIVQQAKKELEEAITVQKSETYISRKKAAEMLDVDLSTLYRWGLKKYLVPVSVGGKKHYKRSDINKMLNY